MLPADKQIAVSELMTGKGDLSRPVNPTVWQAWARVELKDGGLFPAGEARDVRPANGLLEGFFELAEAPDEKIRAFAEKWGILEICEHGLPSGHAPRPCRALAFDTGEPVSVWRQLAAELSALAKISNRLINGKCGEADDWVIAGRRKGFRREHVGAKQKNVTIETPPRRLHVQCAVVANIANEWCAVGNVRPVVVWPAKDKRPAIKTGGNGLFGALAYQLIVTIGQFGNIAVCTHCRREYPLKRQTKRGQRNFCQECREKRIPTTYSSPDCRDRQKAGAKQ
jgi:hypothetical protein